MGNEFLARSSQWCDSLGDLELIEWFEDGSVELYDLVSDPRKVVS